MFADTVRQDLAPSSVLEHVLVERVIAAAWQVQLGPKATAAAKAARERKDADANLESALTLLDLARKLQAPRWGGAVLHGAPVPAAAAPVDLDLDDELPADWTTFEDDGRFGREDDPDLDDDFEFDADFGDDSEVVSRWHDRLVFDHNVSETSPVVKGTWVTVGHVVSLIVDGWSWADVLRSHPELTEDDVRTCLAYTVEQDDRGAY